MLRSVGVDRGVLIGGRGGEVDDRVGSVETCRRWRVERDVRGIGAERRDEEKADRVMSW